MYLDATLTAGSTGAADSLTRDAVAAGLNADRQPQGGRLGILLRLHGTTEPDAFDALLSPYLGQVSDLTASWIEETP
jgi:hypothetical protein